MLLGVTPVGLYALDEIPPYLDVSTPVPFWGFYDDDYAQRIYVLCVNPLPLTSSSDTFWYPLGVYPLGYLTPADRTVPEVKYYANKALVTNSTDTPPSTTIPSRLVQPINFRASIPLPGSTSVSGSSSFGFARIANTGDLDDDLIGASWAGRDAVVYIGGTMHPGRADEQVLQFSEYQKLYTLQVADISADIGSVDVSLRDPIFKLSGTVQISTYLGNETDYEGLAEIKGQYKPICLGQCFRVPAVLVGEDYTYQYHNGAGTVQAVYDNGIALNEQEDSTDLPNLTVTTGNYATDNSRGLVKIGDEPSSEIVVDCTGVGGTTVSSILEYLAGQAAIDIENVSFNSYGNQSAGFWCDTSAVEISTVFNELMSSIDGWYIFRRDGKISLGEHTSISATPSVLTIDGREDGLPGIVEGSLRRSPGPPPVWKYTLGWKKYGATTVIEEEQYEKDLRKKYKRDRRKRRTRLNWQKYKLADSLNPDDISDWNLQFRKITPQENSRTLDYFKNSIAVEKDTHLITESEVDTLATGMLNRDGRLRGLYSFKITRNLYKLFPGEVITLQHDRFNLSSGKKGRVISMTEDAASETTSLEVLIDE